MSVNWILAIVAFLLLWAIFYWLLWFIQKRSHMPKDIELKENDENGN